MKCKKGYEIHVLKSAAGYYRGTVDEEGIPNCRLSGYAKTFEEASSLALSREIGCIENDFCNGGKGCLTEY